MRITIRILAILLIITLVSGCPIPHLAKSKCQMYPGPELLKDQIAIIMGSHHGFFAIIPSYTIVDIVDTDSVARIHKVDGQMVSTVTPYTKLYTYDADEVQVLPGPHEVKVWLSKYTKHRSACFPSQTSDSRLLTFNLNTQAGHTYKIIVPLYWRENSTVEIKDEATGEVVASQAVPPLN